MFDGIGLGCDLPEYEQNKCLRHYGHHIGKYGVLSLEQDIIDQRAGDAHKGHVHQNVAEQDRDEQPAGIIQEFDDGGAAFLLVLPVLLELDFGQSREGCLGAGKEEGTQ